MKLRRNSNEQPPGLDWERHGPWRTHNELTSRQSIEHEGTTYLCRVRNSADDSWQVAYGAPISSGRSRAFLFSGDQLEVSMEVECPIGAVVSNGGTCMILGGGNTDQLNGTVVVFDSSGNVVIEDTFQANVSDGDLSTDGSLAVVQTHPPDSQTYIYDLYAEQLITAHSSDWGKPTVARFGVEDSTQYVYLSSSHTKSPLYALDEGGEMVWESDRHRKRRPLFDRIRTRLRSS